MRADSETDLLPLDDAAMASLRALFDSLGREGFRVLGIAWRQVENDYPHAVVSDETKLVFSGFAAFLDPPKESAKKALADLAASGVSVKIVTGDNELVTKHICGQLGLPITGILTGADILKMDDQALVGQVENVNLFCRVTPAQKNRIILALKKRGHTVGYLGDGINDAPSLHSADIGISVDSAVDVAKDAAEMILLEHDLRASTKWGHRGAPHLRQYYEVYHDGDQLQFRQHVQYGRRILVPSLSSHASHTDFSLTTCFMIYPKSLSHWTMSTKNT